jgi:hypothetical protein
MKIAQPASQTWLIRAARTYRGDGVHELVLEVSVSTVRVRTVIGSAHAACPLCHAEDDHLVVESKDRHRLPVVFGDKDLHLRRYLICGACGARSQLRDDDAIVIDVRDAAS